MALSTKSIAETSEKTPQTISLVVTQNSLYNIVRNSGTHVRGVYKICLDAKGKKMKGSHRIAIIGIVISSLSSTAARAETDPNTKITGLFDVSLYSSKYVTGPSFFFPSGGFEQPNGQLRLDCEINMSDPNLVLGISRRGNITRVGSDDDKTVDVVDQRPSGRTNMLYIYHAPRYRTQFVAPIRVPEWKKTIRSILRLPPPQVTLPKWTVKLVPSHTTLDIDPELFGQDSEKINRIEGYFHVLVAESLEYIDVPFKASKEWVRLTADLEIKVLEARTNKSEYDYRIETRRSERAIRTPLTPATILPKRFPVSRLLISRDGRSTGRRSGPIFGLKSVGGRGSGGGIGPIEKIRFVIAVNPSHHKIPFVLEDIPLPKN
jgi:hypothetical protein